MQYNTWVGSIMLQRVYCSDRLEQNHNETFKMPEITFIHHAESRLHWEKCLYLKILKWDKINSRSGYLLPSQVRRVNAADENEFVDTIWLRWRHWTWLHHLLLQPILKNIWWPENILRVISETKNIFIRLRPGRRSVFVNNRKKWKGSFLIFCPRRKVENENYFNPARAGGLFGNS